MYIFYLFILLRFEIYPRFSTLLLHRNTKFSDLKLYTKLNAEILFMFSHFL